MVAEVKIMKTSEGLKQAKALIADPKNWIKNSFYLDEDGNHPYNSQKPACQFCTIGAWRQAAESNFGVISEDFIWKLSEGADLAYETLVVKCSRSIHAAMKELGCSTNAVSAASYNDDPETTHADIMALYDKAIEIAEREENNA